MRQLFNYQYDFIKVRTQCTDREGINWDSLTEHPTIRNAYVLAEGSELYGKNLKLYFGKSGNVTLETSIAYLLEGHNHVGITCTDLEYAIFCLGQETGIDFTGARVSELEFGAFAKTDGDIGQLMGNTVGLRGYDLRFGSNYMKMFGKGCVNLKIYDAVANARKKGTFKHGGYPEGGLVKYELKYTDMKRYLKSELPLEYLYEDSVFEAFKHELGSAVGDLEYSDGPPGIDMCEATSLSDILFVSLLQLQHGTGRSVHREVMRTIEVSHLSPSQKSKRRRSLIELGNRFNQNGKSL